jgi:hypothetical protein
MKYVTKYVNLRDYPTFEIKTNPRQSHRSSLQVLVQVPGTLGTRHHRLVRDCEHVRTLISVNACARIRSYLYLVPTIPSNHHQTRSTALFHVPKGFIVVL